MMSPARTRANGCAVPSVMLSSMRFRARTASGSNCSKPWWLAVILTRPWMGARAVVPAPDSAAPTADAASASSMSSAPGIATVRRSMPLDRAAAISSMVSRWPLASRLSPIGCEWARIAPRQASISWSPKIIAQPRACRQAATIWAATDRAISGGLAAPMSRPAGPWTRASAASSKPRARSRSSRAAWVLREPSAPM